MIKRLLSILFILLFSQGIMAQTAEFETASEAVKNMKIGWNLVNTLDSYANPEKDTWFQPEGWWSWETAWGNPVTKPELMKMIRKAGFKTMRIPVTWFPHTDTQGNIDPEWMDRVHEVVDYVIDQGMYCILNTHHDTGYSTDENTGEITKPAKLIAELDNYRENKDWFENVWRQIANEFKDYDQHLLFEAYNEMADKTGALGIPSENLGEDHARESYQAINDYAQSFVNAVRSTGGNNLKRNLIVNTHGACVGPVEEEWCRRPYRELRIPDDVTENHIIFGIHCYWMDTDDDARKIINNVNECFTSRGVPTIISEYGTGMDHLDVALTKQASENGIAPIIWNGDFCYGTFREYPAFDDTAKVVTALKTYYGDWYKPQLLVVDDYDTPYIASFEEYDSELGLLTETSLDDLIGYRIDLADTPEKGKLEIVAIGEKGSQFQEVQSKSTTITFDNSILGDKLTFLYMRSKHSGLYTVKVNSSVAIFRSKPYEKKIFGWNNNKCDVKYLFIRKQFVHNVAYNERWAELNIFYDDVPLKLKNYKGIRLELAEPLADAQVKVYGDGGQKEDYLPLTGVSTTISFNKEIFSSEINRVTLQNTQDGKSQAKVISAWLIRQDGTEEYSDLSPFHGCKITDITKYEGNSDTKDQYLVNPSFDHDLSGWTNTNGTARWKENTWEVLSNYCEFEWTGGPIVNQEVVQFPTLPAGNYRLSFDCASDTNSKGLYLVAGSNTKELPGADGINSFSLDFSVAEESPIKIGFKVENTTATWVNFDNFKLEKISSTAFNSIKADDSHHAIIYNLAGQRLSKPQKGINIIDGKKVVVK